MRAVLTDLAQTGIAISLVDLVVGLALATLLSLAIVVVYRRTHHGLHYERSFLVTLVMIPPIVGVVMMLIGSNLALSLGMVGALSIIRFRTVIKDSRDMVYLFFAIAVGLGCGTYNWTVTTIATVFLALLLFVLYLLQFGSSMHPDFALVLSGAGHKPDGRVKQTIREHVDVSAVRSINVNEDGWEMVFEVRYFADSREPEDQLFHDLRTKHGVERISLLAPQLSLPV